MNYLRVGNNVVVIMAKTTRTSNELTENGVAEWVSTPAVRVTSFDLLSFLPALLLNSVGEASGV
ncbi:hypothetical protein HanPI659440_Chr16g0624461 [Helianthus annuus]|nr:hypothetical protein HanPI659440_Chr16g0624461 [Helianthus annuus]